MPSTWDYQWHKDPEKKAQAIKDAREKADRLRAAAKKAALKRKGK